MRPRHFWVGYVLDGQQMVTRFDTLDRAILAIALHNGEHLHGNHKLVRRVQRLLKDEPGLRFPVAVE